jgi:[protein-PII] uridylyltransferase
MAEVSLRERRQRLVERPDLGGTAFCEAYAAEADEWLAGLAGRAVDGNPRSLALLAVGGYGRRELCPYSDLDVVLVHDGIRNVRAVADAIWYPVWDEGVHLDHSVRRPAEVLAAAEADLRVALGLLDARLVWGEPKVATPLLSEAVSLWRNKLGAQWLPALSSQMKERHRTQGDLAFLLEPDLKEAHGGLRDASVLRAMAVYAPKLSDYVDLESVGPAASTLLDIRVELHRRVGRALDKLLLQEQDQIASILSYRDADDLMASVARAGRTIAWAVDDAWRRQASWQPAREARFGLRRTRQPVTVDRVSVEPGILIVGNEVALEDDAAIAQDSSLALRLAAVAAERDLPIAKSALRRLADRMPPAPDPWPLETREALVRVLLAGRPAIAALESLDQEDLVSRLLPEWSPVRSRPQRNAYHRFTVDRHLLETAAGAAALRDSTDRPDLLVIGALLHDIGKGYPGDHTEVGIELVSKIGDRMGFPRRDVDILMAMIRHHLLLPDAATRRDLDDPVTIEKVAEAAGDTRTLALLGALAEADGQATGSSAWGPWKAGLVSELVKRTSAHLEGRPLPSGPGWVNEGHHRLMEEVRQGGPASVMLDPPQVTVAAADRPGLLASVAGILALHGLDVRSADATSRDGVAVEVFTVEVPRGSWPDSARLRQDLDAVLANRLELGSRLAARAEAYAGERRSRSATTLTPQVSADNGASASSTVLELRAPDEIGLLHRVTQALFDLDLDVVSARVSTIGHEVVDAFYVRTAAGEKVTDSDRLRSVEEAVRAAAD